MSQEVTPQKKKLINWASKKRDDKTRIYNRLNHRETQKEKIDMSEGLKRKNLPPKVTGKPLKRLLKKIKELYEEDDEDDVDVCAPLFNIDFIDENEREKKEEKRIKNTLFLSRQHQFTRRFNLLIDSIKSAREAGLSTSLTTEDINLLDRAQISESTFKSKTITEKISKPLNKKASTSDAEELTNTLKQLEKSVIATDTEASKIIEKDEQALAKIILDKAGLTQKKKPPVNETELNPNVREAGLNNSRKKD